MKEQTHKLKIGDKELTFTLNSWAEQANGSCRVQLGDTVVLVTAVMSRQDNENLGFFPLTVDYEERYYAAGKILGSRFMRREGRPSEEAIITARLIDRAIRPLFPKNLKREVQVIITCLSWDGVNDPDIPGLLGASMALSISDIPWQGPLGGMRATRVGDKFVANSTYEERQKSDLDFIMAGTQEKDVLLNMIEAESNEVGEQVYEEALDFGKPLLAEAIRFQRDIMGKEGKEKLLVPAPQKDEAFEEEMRSLLGARLREALFTGDKLGRMERVDQLKEELFGWAREKERQPEAKNFFEEETERLVVEGAVRDGARVDGRKPEEIRPLKASVGILPRTHGSALFERGQTKTLSLLTLGGPGDHKLLDGMEVRGKKRFMHHYNFPPYAPGEVKRLGSPGRREIGHGMLAEKALLPVIPEFDRFPYTVRIVTEVVSSNGSTSMASACSSSLALMDAGVPITRPVAGISLGLMGQGKDAVLLTDIQGPEDHHGDMDFKVAGTEEGITAMQLDVKTRGIGEDLFKETLRKAKEARLHIIKEVIGKTLPGPRKELSAHAPKISVFQVKPEKIGQIIGPGGKVINGMVAEFGVDIDIEEDGGIYVSGENAEGVAGALERIKNIVREAEIGETYQGKVKRIMDFGAFVEIFPGQEGLVHISQLAPHRVEKVTDVVKLGDTIPVKVLEIDAQGRVNLSLKEAKDQK